MCSFYVCILDYCLLLNCQALNDHGLLYIDFTVDSPRSVNLAYDSIMLEVR